MLVAEKKITVPEYLQMDFESEGAYYELINGQIVRKAAPHLRHQDCIASLSLKLGNFIAEKKLGKLYTAPTDVFLNEFNHVLPDIFFVSNEKMSILDYEEGVVTGVPDLIVEILSPSTAILDRYDKKQAYAETGVKEFWLVDPNNFAVEILENQDGRYEPFSFASEDGTVKSKVLEGFELELKELFGR